MQMHGPRSPREKDRDLHWRIKAKTSEELRQEFLTIYVPRIRELGLVIPDPELRFDETTGEWRYTEPDWDELRTVVTNHGPMSEARLEFRRLAREETRWVREAILARAAGGMTREQPGGGPAEATVPETPVLEAWEVFRQEKDGDPMRHGGSVMAPDAELAIALRPRAVRPPPGERPAVGRPPRRHRRPRRPGPAPAAARPLVQEARRLRDARQAGRRPRGSRARRSRRRARDDRHGRPAGDRGLAELLRSMADDEFVIGFSDSEWTGHRAAPRGGRGDELARPGRAGPRGRAVRAARRADRHRRRRARLRPRARRVPPLPAARPRPRRLGDDDRPPLPVRHAPTPSGSRRSPAGSWAPLAELVGKLVREERYHRMHVGRVAGPAGAQRAASRATGCWPPSTTLGAGRGDGLHAARRRGRHWSRPGSWPPRWPSSRRRWRAAIAPTLRRPRPADAAAGARPGARPARPRRRLPLAVGRVHDRSAAPTRGRPGERGRDPRRRWHGLGPAMVTRGRCRAPAAVDEAAVRAALAEVMDPELPMRLGRRPRDRPSRRRRASTTARSASRSCRRSSAARRSSSSGRRSPSGSRALRPPGRGRRDLRRCPWTSDRITAGRAAPAPARTAGHRAADRPRADASAARTAARGRVVDGQRVRPDAVPDRSSTAATAASRSKRSSRSDRGRLRRSGTRRRHRRGRDDGRRDRPGRLEAGHEVVLHDVDPAAIERGARADPRRAGRGGPRRLDLDPDSIDDWVDGRLDRLRHVADRRRPRRRRRPRHRGRARGPRGRSGRSSGRSTTSPTPDAILATNTSALSVAGDRGGDRPGPERVIGLHFFNPAPLMALVEVVARRLTDPAVVDAGRGAR